MCPDALLHYLGFDCDFRSMTISLHAERVTALRALLDEVCAADSITVGTALSLVGTLVFCSAVIRIGRVHYRAIIVCCGLRPTTLDERAVAEGRDSARYTAALGEHWLLCYSSARGCFSRRTR